MTVRIPSPRRILDLPIALAAGLLLSAWPQASLADVVVSECGQEVVTDVAVLQDDLDCSSYPGIALTLRYSVLKMNGHTITSRLANHDPTYASHGLPAVYCDKSCRVLGPGTITGAGGGTGNGAGCCVGEALSGEFITARNVTIEGNGGSGVGGRNVKLYGCTIRDNAGYGVSNHYRAKIVRSTIEGNGLHGIMGINAIGTVQLLRSSVTGNAGFGVYAHNSVIRNADITANVVDPDACQGPLLYAEPCVDLYLSGRSISYGVTCGTSYDAETDAPTGLCSGE